MILPPASRFAEWWSKRPVIESRLQYVVDNFSLSFVIFFASNTKLNIFFRYSLTMFEKERKTSSPLSLVGVVGMREGSYGFKSFNFHHVEKHQSRVIILFFLYSLFTYRLLCAFLQHYRPSSISHDWMYELLY